jgi:hypothetical protein
MEFVGAGVAQAGQIGRGVFGLEQGVETGAEMFRMREGLPGAQAGGDPGLSSWSTAEFVVGDAHEEMLLIKETECDETGGFTGMRKSGEVNMGGDVAGAGIAEHVVGAAMIAVGRKGSGASEGCVVAGSRKTVVDGEDVTATEDADHQPHPGARAEIDFGGVAFEGREVEDGGGELRVGDGFFSPGELAAGAESDVALEPDFLTTDDDGDGKGIDEFVGEEDAGWIERGQVVEIGKPDHGVNEPDGLDFFALEELVGRDGLDDGVAEGSEEFRGFGAAPGEDVAGELGVLGALLDDPEGRGHFQFLPHLEKLAGEKTAEERADADAGEEVALAAGAGLLARAAVVAEFGMIEGEIHEALEGNGARRRDFGADEGGEFAHGDSLQDNGREGEDQHLIRGFTRGNFR